MSQPHEHEPNPISPISPTSTEPTPVEIGQGGHPMTLDKPSGSAESAHADAPSAKADAPPAALADSREDSREEEGDESEGDEGDADGEAKADGETTSTATDGSAPRKKRRRRRKKKGPGALAEGEGEAASPADGAPAEGQGPRRERRERPRKERTERERPAFNVGDVVFGKVLEVTEDALFADLAGKAKAIFDLRELLITEEDVEEYERAAKKEAEEIAAARAASAQAAAEKIAVSAPSASTEPGADGAEGESPSAGEADASEPSELSEDEAPVRSRRTVEAPGVQAITQGGESGDVEAAAPETEAAAAATDATDATPDDAHTDDDAALAAPVDGEKGPQLPRVILEPGATFVGLVHNDGGRGGLVVLTHHPKRAQKVKPIVGDASRTGALVFGLVTGTIKGGVEVDVDGLRAFAPASHVELRPGSDLSHLVGKRLPFAVTQYAKRGRDVVLSRRAMLETEAKERREEALKHLEIGSIVTGIVRTVVPFGAFIDVGGIEGLVPLSEMSHNRADQPKDVFKVNEECAVKILRVDEKGKLWLSRRSAVEDPWAKVAERYALGTKHKGKVVRLQPFGAFIELESGIDGLIHTADLSVKRIEHPEEVVKVGDEIEVVVANVDSRAHRIALHPAPTGDAANEAPQRIQLHKTLKVVVVAVESGGLAVRVLGATGRSARGFISAAATGTPRGTELRKLFPVGKELDVKVMEMDPRRGEVKLSIKALNDETERNAYQQYRAQVKREAKFGTFADLLAKRNVTPTK